MNWHEQRRPKQRQTYKMSSSDILIQIAGKIPKLYYDRLKTTARELGIDMSVAIARSVVNELNCENPFYENWDNNENVPYINTDAELIRGWVLGHPGFSKEHLLLLWQEIGVSSKESFVNCFNFLKENRFLIMKRSRTGYEGYIYAEKLPEKGPLT